MVERHKEAKTQPFFLTASYSLKKIFSSLHSDVCYFKHFGLHLLSLLAIFFVWVAYFEDLGLCTHSLFTVSLLVPSLTEWKELLWIFCTNVKIQVLSQCVCYHPAHTQIHLKVCKQTSVGCSLSKGWTLIRPLSWLVVKTQGQPDAHLRFASFYRWHNGPDVWLKVCDLPDSHKTLLLPFP